MFKKEDFKGDFLNFDDGFEISENLGNQIILGSNGIGKSTIYKKILELHPDYGHIDYEEMKDGFIKNKNKLIIGAQIAELEQKKDNKFKLINDLHIKDNFKSLNISTQKDAKAIMPELNEVFVNNNLGIMSFNSEKLKIINSLSKRDIIFLISKYSKLNVLDSLEGELENLKNEFMKSIYNQLDKILGEREYICPICGKMNNVPIKELIAEKNKQLLSIQNEILKEYQQRNKDLTPNEIINHIRGIISCIRDNKIDNKDIINYYICGGEEEKAELIEKAKPQFIQLENEISILEQNKERYYTALKENETAIREVFENKFNVPAANIVFKDLESSVVITLPRNADKYSTGELNLMVFTFSIYQFTASNKKVLVVDDPLSSYDISNQYRIMFDLVEVTKTDKVVIIFTHNIDCINISNSQYRGVFTYKYIEKMNNTLYLKNINLNNSDSIMNIKNLMNYVACSENKDKYFKLLIEREENQKDEKNSIFHYDCSYEYNYEGSILTNEYFVSIIDNFNDLSIENSSFEQNSIDKIIYMAAIRVWIEKQFYHNCSDSSALCGKTFSEKIEWMFPRKSNKRWTGSDCVTRKYLMSKKTMINQHNHYKSQILPFNYALNITLDELKIEIMDIKNHFMK